MNGLDRHEGRSLNHTSLKGEVGVHTRGIESKHKAADIIHSRKCGNLSLATAALKLEIDIAIACIGLPYVCCREGAGAAAAHSQLLPAVGQNSCGQLLETGAVWHRRVTHAGRAESGSAGPSTVRRAVTHSTDIDIIEGVGSKAVDSIRISRGSVSAGVCEIGYDAVAHDDLPVRCRAIFGPADVSLVVVDIADGDIAWGSAVA